MKFYKVVQVYNNRLFSSNSSPDSVKRLIQKQKRISTGYTAAVEYRLNKWTYKPRTQQYNSISQHKLFVFANLEDAQSMCRQWKKVSRRKIIIYECEVKNPERFMGSTNYTYIDGMTYLCTAVKLIKEI